jgi:hypothetical protein
MVLLVLRHTLAILISGAGDYSMTLFMVRLGSVACSSYKKLQLGLPNGAGKKKTQPVLYMQLLILRTVGILLPVYVMVRAFTAIQHRGRQQVSED